MKKEKGDGTDQDMRDAAEALRAFKIAARPSGGEWEPVAVPEGEEYIIVPPPKKLKLSGLTARALLAVKAGSSTTTAAYRATVKAFIRWTQDRDRGLGAEALADVGP